MRRNLWIFLICIIAVTVLAGLVDWPKGPNIFGREIKVHEGLDLQGGTHLVYELDTSKYGGKDVKTAQQAVVNVIEKRINKMGVSEPVIQPSNIGNKATVIVELPGVSDINEAINRIGSTAQLKFQEADPNDPTKLIDTGLTGEHVKRATSEINTQSGEPYVGLEFDSEGSKQFAEITKKNLNKQVAIVLDSEIISAPTVNSVIEGGKAEISGKFTVAEVKSLTEEINGGALPVPIKLIAQQNIGATLGSESVQKSLVAGLIGLILIGIFMIVYYKVPGLISVISLVIYTIITLAVFKIFPQFNGGQIDLGITITLAGIAGFILSAGMAVDANILIFERTKEEEASGKSISSSLEEGFKRAWSSIRDSNFSSLITAGILYFGTSGMVKGFAITLIIGILVSMFTAIIVTRTFLRLLVGTRFEKLLTIK